MLKTYLAIMLGGAIGTALRFGLSNWLDGTYGGTFPIGVLVVNVSGCFIIGLYAALTGPEGPLLASPLTRQVITIGVLGGYTTFSSFSLNTLNLARGGEWWHASWNVVLSVILCLVAVWLGQVVASLLQQR